MVKLHELNALLDPSTDKDIQKKIRQKNQGMVNKETGANKYMRKIMADNKRRQDKKHSIQRKKQAFKEAVEIDEAASKLLSILQI